MLDWCEMLRSLTCIYQVTYHSSLVNLFVGDCNIHYTRQTIIYDKQAKGLLETQMKILPKSNGKRLKDIHHLYYTKINCFREYSKQIKKQNTKKKERKKREHWQRCNLGQSQNHGP